MRRRVLALGSASLMSWKRRASAGSFSKYFLYSLQVVAAKVRSSPRASAGLSRLAASPPPAWTARADEGVGLVDEKNDGFFRGLDFVYDAFAGGFRIRPSCPLRLRAPPCPGRAAVTPRPASPERPPGHDAQRKPLDDGRLAHARFADQDGVVFASSGQDVHGLADFFVPAEDRDRSCRLGRTAVKSWQIAGQKRLPLPLRRGARAPVGGRRGLFVGSS